MIKRIKFILSQSPQQFETLQAVSELIKRNPNKEINVSEVVYFGNNNNFKRSQKLMTLTERKNDS